MNEITYKVVWPLGRLRYESVALKTRVSDFKGKTICELSDYGFKAEEIFPILRESLKKVYPDISFVDYPNFGNIHGSNEVQVIQALPELLSKFKCDAVISGVGG